MGLGNAGAGFLVIFSSWKLERRAETGGGIASSTTAATKKRESIDPHAVRETLHTTRGSGAARKTGKRQARRKSPRRKTLTPRVYKTSHPREFVF